MSEEVVGEKQSVGCDIMPQVSIRKVLEGEIVCAHLLEEKTLVLGRRKQQVAPKRWYLSATLHGVKSQKTAFLKTHLHTVFRYFTITIITGTL